ncbi:Hypothetical predicted protein [Octopus vulgaris]|uniref:Uncharacterized protein n=1 Tax=Octopus vulgaris TaxID=6645 RepID=A0AA36F7J8_OCTVU|nr:Hypothetical predicted protein [Octopus vulgaris]
MDCLENALMAKIWNIILVRFNSPNKAFQGVKVDLIKAIDLTDSLESFLKSFRDRLTQITEVWIRRYKRIKPETVSCKT